MTQELTPCEKIDLLIKKHELGCLFDPGGTLLANSEKGIKIRIPDHGTEQEDYEKLLNGLRALGLEGSPS
jgi:hypothetical protein